MCTREYRIIFMHKSISGWMDVVPDAFNAAEHGDNNLTLAFAYIDVTV